MDRPKLQRIDLGDRELDVLTREQANELLAKGLGRNDPCFCGSGRKFKHCHFNQLRTIAGR
jgi:uncharacterized protein YecA (UPF0149 family)